MKLTMVSGAVGTVKLSRTHHLKNAATIRGTLGWMKVWFYEPRVAWHIGDRPETHEFNFRRDAGLQYNVFNSLFVDQLASWVSAITTGGTVAVDASAGQRVVDLIQRCYATRKPLQLPWTIGDPSVSDGFREISR